MRIKEFGYYVITFAIIILLAVGALYARTSLIRKIPNSAIHAAPVVISQEVSPVQAATTPSPVPAKPIKVVTQSLKQESVPPIAPQDIPVFLIVDGHSYQLDVPIHASVYDVMQQARQKQFITFESKEFSGLGFFIESINGVASDNKSGTYWIYYVNNKKAQVGVSSYQINSGETITWKYERENN